MSNDPLDSFVVPNKQTPDLDIMPSMRAASAKSVDTRREPRLSARTTDTPADAQEKPVKAEKQAATRKDRKPVAPTPAVKTEASALAERPTTGAPQKDLPAEKTKKELKKTMQAAKQAARQAEKRDRFRKSRGSRFALYLVFIVAAGFVLAIVSNSMIHSMEQLRDAQTGSAVSTATANQQVTDPK